jgi:esterase/lipase
MWSLETSTCKGSGRLANVAAPSLVVQSMADQGVFPSDARAIFAALGASDKSLEFVPGRHYFEEGEASRDRLADLLAGWIGARV